MNTRKIAPFALTAAALSLCACSDYRKDRDMPPTEAQAQAPHQQQEVYPDTPQAVTDRFLAKDPTLRKFFDTSYAYAVFPKIGKGAIGVGAAHGYGNVFEQQALVGTAEMTQVTLGAQLGGQTYSEIIFFRSQADFNVFKQNNMEFAANASAIAAESGKGAANDFNSNGTAVFVLPRGGLMFEAAIGGQKFTFRPMNPTR